MESVGVERTMIEKISELPTEMTLGKGSDDERTYDILSFIEEGEAPIDGHEMVRRVEQLGANLGKDHLQKFSDRKNEIPPELDFMFFVFTDVHRPNDPDRIACVRYCGNDSWRAFWFSLSRYNWGDNVHVLSPRD